MTASPEFDALMAQTQLEREKADGIKSLIAASKLAARYQHRAEVAEAALVVARVALAEIGELIYDVEHHFGCRWCSGGVCDCAIFDIHAALDRAMVSVWDTHFHTADCWRDCRSCGIRWHLPTSERTTARRIGWLCPDCAPPEPHCSSCTCYSERGE